MIKRYTTERMQRLWKDKTKFKSFLKVELAVLKAYSHYKIIPSDDVKKIEKNAKINLDRIQELEVETRHDVIAFTRSISEYLGKEKKWFHYGLTSTDVVDTAYAIQIKKANKYIKEALEKFILELKEKAFEYKNTPIVGRTHGIHAEITSFGLKWALYYDEMQRNLKRFKRASKQIEIGKLSGAVGNFSIISPKIQDYTCEILGLSSSNISTQTLQRDRHANYIFSLSLITSTLEKIAVEIRHLQRTEVNEVAEGFLKNQKGSSAMPHKKNPIASENITGISRILNGYVVTALENIPLWHERDISHSSTERIILPDSTSLVDYSLQRFSKVIKNLKINKEKMLENIWLTNGLIFSQRVLTELINSGNTREESYDVIQKIALESWDNKKDFKELLLKDSFVTKHLSKEKIESLFDIKFYLKNVDLIFKRVFKD